jgi:glycosyltransferase involved in cell wall biosynthesis
MSPTRILVLTPEFGAFSWGGLATYLHSVVPRLSAHAMEVDVVVGPTYAAALAPIEAGAHCGTAYTVVDATLSHAAQWQAFEACASAHYDAVYVQDQALAHLAIELKRRGRTDRIVSAAHLPSYGGFSYFDRPVDDIAQHEGEALILRHSDRVVAPSAFAADLLLRVHRLSPHDVAVIPLGTTLVDPPARIRVEGTPLDVVVVGRIAKQKGLPDLVEVVDLVPPEVARFTHIGRELLASDRTRLASRRLRLLGPLSHDTVIDRLLRADVLLSMSLHETFGLAVLEAMTCGAVPVAFACGALNELVSDGTDGVLVSVGDTRAIARVLGRLHTSAFELAELSRRAVTSATRYSWERHVERLAMELVPA